MPLENQAPADDRQTAESELRERLLAMWSDIMTRGTGLSPSDAAHQELVEYSGLPLEEVVRLDLESNSITARKWAEVDHTPEGLKKFYCSVTEWVFGTLGYHARQAEAHTTTLPIDAAMAIDGHQPGDHLDFGAGVATASLMFARLGWKISIADVSPPLLDFARWRLARANVPAEIIDLQAGQTLPKQRYDLITAFNTMVHVADPLVAIRDLHEALRPGGLLVFDIDARNGDEGWYLYKHHYPFIRAMRRMGFSRPRKFGMLYVYQRVELSAVQRRIAGFIDGLRYNGVASAAGDMIRSAKSKLRPAKKTGQAA